MAPRMRWYDFRDHLIAASLKLAGIERTPSSRLAEFRDHLIAASLKPAISLAGGASPVEFRDQLIAASLKRNQR